VSFASGPAIVLGVSIKQKGEAMSEYENLAPSRLAGMYNAVNHEFKRLQEALSSRRAEDRHVVKAKDWVWKTSGETIGLQFKKTHQVAYLIAPELGFNVYNFHAFVVEIPPGGQEGAYHSHGEAVKFYLKGRGREIIGDKVYEVEAGDAMFVPADVWHGTQNPYDEAFRFYAVAYTDIGVPLMRSVIFRSRKDLESDEVKKAALSKPVRADYERMDAWEMISARRTLLKQIGRLEEEMERRRKLDRHHVKAAELNWEPSGRSTGMKERSGRRNAKAVSPEMGFNVHNFQSFFVEIDPGKSEGAYHSHSEALKLYIKGRGREIIGGKEYDVEAGDLVFIPANTWHGSQNPSMDEPLRFFAVTQGRRTPLAVQVPFKIRDDLRD